MAMVASLADEQDLLLLILLLTHQSIPSISIYRHLVRIRCFCDLVTVPVRCVRCAANTHVDIPALAVDCVFAQREKVRLSKGLRTAP